MPVPILGVLGIGLKLVDTLFTSDEEKQEAKLKLMAMQQAGELTELEKAAEVIVTEAKSEHPLTSQWRPITMLVFVVIIANNYILYPYLSLFWPEAPRLELPPAMWELLKIGLGGYVLGRSAEKTAKVWRAREGSE